MPRAKKKKELKARQEAVLNKIREGGKFEPYELRDAGFRNWYEGLEDDINNKRVTSLAQVEKNYQQRKERLSKAVQSRKSEMSPETLKRFEQLESKAPDAAKMLLGLSNISKGINLEGFLEGANKQSREQNPGLIQQMLNVIRGKIPTGQQVKDTVFGYGPRHEFDVPLYTKEQEDLANKLRKSSQQYLPQFMEELSKPIETPQSQLGNNIGDILGLLSGPAMMSLMQRPSQNMFTGQFASQLPYQQNYSSGISTLLGTLGAPLLQQLLGRKG